jgi:hypothetical protein
VFVGFAFLFLLLLLYILLRKELLATLALFVIALAVEILAFASIGPYLYWISSILVALSITIVVVWPACHDDSPAIFLPERHVSADHRLLRVVCVVDYFCFGGGAGDQRLWLLHFTRRAPGVCR